MHTGVGLAWKRLARGIALALLLCGSAAASGACGQAVPSTSGAVLDDLGRTVSVENPAQRIVSLAPSNTELLFALGLGDRLVGVTAYCDYPPEALDKESVGDFSTPDLERVLALQPDLVVAASIHEADTIPALERSGLTVVALAPATLDDMLNDIRLLGELTGCTEEASLLAGALAARIEAVTTKAAGAGQEPRVLHITWHEPIWTVGSATTTQELIDRAGGTNIYGHALTGHAIVELESVVGANPEIIVASAGHGEAQDKPFDWAMNEPRLAGTAARQNGRVYSINADWVSRNGPRIVDALECYAYYLHPDLFPRPEGGDE